VERVERDDGSAALGEFERLAAFDGLLSTHLVLVVLGEIADDDWDGQSDHQYSAHTARRANHLPYHTTTIIHHLTQLVSSFDWAHSIGP